MTTNFRLLTLASAIMLGTTAHALPIDWSGTFGVDSHYLSNIRKTTKRIDETTIKDGSQQIAGSKKGTTFQSYIFKLNPTIIINDGVTLKGEFSTGSIRGNLAGNEAENDGSNSYFFASPSQNTNLNINQFYAELYADTALIKIGRMSKDYGLGIVLNGGTEAWDRYFTMYDGIEAEMKIGNFSLIPYWAKISTLGNNNKPAASGELDVRELGAIAKYHNKNRDLLVSILYSQRSSEPDGDFYKDLGKTDVTVIDPFIQKKWKDLTVSFEAPIITGDYGDIFGKGKTKVAANAYILDAQYDLNPKWEVGFKGGQVSGNKANKNKFEAAYLHPNYQIAELMFHYHYPAFTENNSRNIFNSSVTNTQFARFHGVYKTDKWNWKGAFIFANAMEAAQKGKSFYHHEKNYAFDSNYKQAKDLGFEFDFAFDYIWNPNVMISGYYAYWVVGDYYRFTNDAKKQSLSNVHGGGFRVTVGF